MNCFIVHSFSNPTFYLKDYLLPALNPQQMKVAKLALALFSLIALTYYVASHYFAKTKVTQDNNELIPPYSSVEESFYEEVKTSLAEESETILSPAPETQIFDEEIEIVSPVPEQQVQCIETPVTSKKDDLLNIPEEKGIATDSIEIPPINFSIEEPFTTPFQAQIALRTRNGGLIGSEEELPDNFNLYHWKHKDGSDLPIQEDTLLLDFFIFFPSEEFQQLSQGAFNFDLPSFLFTDKKEGDKIQLQYKGKLVELTINQTEIARGRSHKSEDCHFEDVFQCTVKHLSKEISSGKFGFSGSLFGVYKPLEGYTTDFGGVLFHAMHKDPHDFSRKPYIVQTDIDNFREIEALKSKENCFCINDLDTDKVRVLESDKMIIIQSVMCGIDNQVDIVLNEKFLCFYARHQPPSYTLKLQYQYLRIIRWKLLFEDLTLKEMQNRIKDAQTELAAGIFTIKISK